MALVDRHGGDDREKCIFKKPLYCFFLLGIKLGGFLQENFTRVKLAGYLSLIKGIELLEQFTSPFGYFLKKILGVITEIVFTVISSINEPL